MIKHPTLFIGGLDPCAGAGILADVKTAEQIGCYGLGVATALTYQTDREFIGVDWLPFKQICSQIEPLMNRFDIQVAKIGFVENVDELARLVDFLLAHKPELKIVWDPIVSTSTGFVVHEHEHVRYDAVATILDKLYLVTPNLDEIQCFLPELSSQVAAEQMAHCCKVLLKGGHAQGQSCVDALYSNGSVRQFETTRLSNCSKHGSGCVFASAICSFLATDDLEGAISKAQEYMRGYLQSSEDLLGTHKREAA